MVGNSTGGSLANATKDALQSGGLSDQDVQKIVQALGAHKSSGYSVVEFLLGVLVAFGIVAAIYYRGRRRYVSRTNEKEAVKTLREMDDKTIKRILGESNLPSWVNFPDFERVGWVNDVLSQLWPYINSAVSQQFRDLLAPLLRKNKPSWIASLKLFRFDLGDVAPEANGVKVYNHNNDTGEVMIEVDFSWVGNQDVELTIKPIAKHLGPLSPAGYLLSSIVQLRAGVERMIINGRVRFMWKPLLGELPIIGGLQIALVEMPNFSFDVTIYGGDASLVPGLEQWLSAFMKDRVFRPYVLPERYTVSFTDDGNAEELRPKGILFVKLIEAVDVPRMDLFSESDPYGRMFVRHTIQMRSTVKENSSHPKWNESFKFLIHEPESQVWTCILMDYDDFNPDDEIGRATLAIKDLEHEKTEDLWLDIDTNEESEPATDSGEGAGIIGGVMKAEQKVAEAGEKLWKKLPGIIKKNKRCRIHLQATLYMLDKMDLEAAMENDTGKAATAEAEATAGAGDDSSANQREPSNDENSKRQHLEEEDDNGDEGDVEQRAQPHRSDAELGSGAGNQDSAGEHRESVPEQRNGTGGGSPPEDSKTGSDQQPGFGSKKNIQQDVRSEALDSLRGGILYVMPKRAEGLVHKPFYKGGAFVKSSAQLEVSICGQHKSTATAKGSSPVFSETLEFMLGGRDIAKAEHERLKIEVWDHRLHLNHFRGGCSLLLKEVLAAKRMKNTMRLTGVRQGELSLELLWIPALELGKSKMPARPNVTADQQ